MRTTPHTGWYVDSAPECETQSAATWNLLRPAGFLIAVNEGYISLAKNAPDAKVLKAGIRNIVGWLQSLRAPGNHERG